MARFSILNYPIFLPGPLLADTSIKVVSFVVTSVAKTFSWSWPP
jgi:hypothetical protein